MITLIVYIVVLGLIAWLVNAYLPIPTVFKNIVMVVLVIIALLMVPELLRSEPERDAA